METGYLYAYRDGSIDQPDNRALRAAFTLQVPIIHFVSTRPNWLWSTTGIGGRLAGQAGLAATGATAGDATVFELIRRSHR